MTIRLSHLAAQPPSMQLMPGRVARLLDRFDDASFDAVGDFSLRMATHGLSVSSTMMRSDPGYALEQLRHANSLPDLALRDLAAAMQPDFELRRAQGVAAG